MSDDFRELMHRHLDEVVRIRSGWIEMLAAAYLKATNIPPERCELCQESMPNGTIRWWFRERGSNVPYQPPMHESDEPIVAPKA